MECVVFQCRKDTSEQKNDTYLEKETDTIIVATTIQTEENWIFRNPQHKRNHLRSIAFGKNVFVAAGVSTIQNSSDGFVWTDASTKLGAFYVTYGKNVFVAVEGRNILTSLDGATWTLNTDTTRYLYSVIFGDSLFVAVGDSGMIVTSPDGITWTKQAFDKSISFSSITYGNGQFVAIGGINTTAVSSDGYKWDKVETDDYDWFGNVFYGNGKFAIREYKNGSIVSSPDGKTWERSLENTGDLSLRAFVNNVFIGIGNNRNNQPDMNIFTSNDNYYADIFTSNDLYNWTPINSDLPGNFNSLTFGNNLYVAVGDYGEIFSSPDLSKWVNLNTVTNQKLNSISYGNGIYMAVGDCGTLLISPNCSTWTKVEMDFKNEINSVSYGNGMFVAVAFGTILTSTDGTNWSLNNCEKREVLVTIFVPTKGRCVPKKLEVENFDKKECLMIHYQLCNYYYNESDIFLLSEQDNFTG